MTCDEFRRLAFSKNDRETTAERAAHFRHQLDCADCAQWMEAAFVLACGMFPPRVLREMVAKAYKKIVPLVQKDLADPEGPLQDLFQQEVNDGHTESRQGGT